MTDTHDGGHVELDLDHRDRQASSDASVEVVVATPDGGEVLVDPRTHRKDVVRRLLCLGVSARTLIALLPDWAPLIRTTALALSPDELPPHEA